MDINRLTIIVIDSAVYTDTYCIANLDFSSCEIPNDIHALQWFSGSGEIEYIDNRQNLNISTLPNWALCALSLGDAAFAAIPPPDNSSPDPDPNEILYE